MPGRRRGGPAQQSETAERRTKAIALRLAGTSWDDIARALGYTSKASAYADVRRAMQQALDRMAVAADELRQVEGARLDRLQQALWAKALAGDVKAVDAVVRIIDRRIRLFGLDVQPDLTEEQRLVLIRAHVAPQIAAVLGRFAEELGLTPDQLGRTPDAVRSAVAGFLGNGPSRVIEGSVADAQAAG